MIEFEDLRVRHGDHEGLRGISGSAMAGSTIALLGPSGAGKTTLLDAIAGFIDVTHGSIRIGGRDVSRPGYTAPPESRNIGVVFQQNALWPHLSVLDNVAYPLLRAGHGRAQSAELARGHLASLDIASLADRPIATLSGGQQQRVGVARAIARSPSVFLLDEPTAHLDSPMRAEVLSVLRRAQLDSNAVAIIATHDPTEGLAFADHVIVLREGVVAQAGDPKHVYDHPNDYWTGRMTGPASFLSIDTAAGRAEVGGLEVEGDPRSDHLLVRPEWVRIGTGADVGIVTETWFRGSHTDVAIATHRGILVGRAPTEDRYRSGQTVTWSLAKAWAVPAQT